MNKNSATNKDNNKKAMLKALHETMGVITPACEAVGIARSTHYRWMDEDEDYKNNCEDIGEKQIDFVESKLIENINNNDTTGIIFYLKTKGKHRGYIERQEIDHSGIPENKISVEIVKPSEDDD